MNKLAYTMSISHNRASFHLWWKENLLKHQKVLKYYENDCRFNGVFSRDNLLRIKHGAYVANLDYKQSKGTRWVSLFIGRSKVMYLNSFETEYILQQVLIKIKDKSITHNIFRILDDDCIMCRFYCIVFVKYIYFQKNFFRL